MIDIEETATRAIESPIAPPPDMGRVRSLVGRQRRRRAASRATTGVGVAVLAVAIGAAVISSRGSEGVNVITTSPSSTASPTSTVGTLDELVTRLKVDHDVVSEGTASGTPLARVAHLFCVDGTRVHVYEYPDEQARSAVSDTISADGYQIGDAGNVPNAAEHRLTIVDWISAPHFFANGRIIVLMFGDDTRLLAWLTDAIGPTLTTDPQSGSRRQTCADR